ncbi:phytanoyl-CoA dioxygenase family protein [Chloroflexi bacterium TSY]|nr:phytanoyl-CoA dioxygenase family protein [Chloroflexi bacterium TSY]
MTPKTALEKREQMLRDGYCVIDDILTDEFLQELNDESERLIAGHVPPPDVRYQGQHVNVHRSENEVIHRLLDWAPTRQALEELGFGDFEAMGGIIILTKDPGEPALYWHQDWMQSYHELSSVIPKQTDPNAATKDCGGDCRVQSSV